MQISKSGIFKIKMMITKAIAIKFFRHDVPELETLKHSKVYQLREKLNKGDKLNRAEKNWLAQAIYQNSYYNNAVPLMGYRFGFEDVLKNFIVKQYGNWSEYYAPDKTSLKSFVYGRIEKIVEIKN